MATKLGLYELLAPFFLAGFNLPDHIDKYLAVLGVEELHTAIDDAAIVYTGICTLDGDAAAQPHMQHHAPTGELFTWRDTQLRFRLTIPRIAISPWLAAQLGQVTAAGGALVGLPDPGVQSDGRLLQNIGALLQNGLQPAGGPGVPPTTDAPHFAFRLELMITEVALHLGKSWRPAVFADHRLVIDPADPAGDVRFILPRVTFQYQQAQDPLANPTFILKSWGQGFDGSTDLLGGELVRMEPGLCIHESGRVGFGVDGVLLDLSPNSTPPEILQHFGVGDDWTGLYIRSLRVYASVSAADLAFTLSVKDAVIGFNGEVSLEARLDVVNTETFSMQVLLFDGDRRIGYAAGDPDGDLAKVVPGHGQAPGGAIVQVVPIGGVPDFLITVTLAGVALPWQNDQAVLPASYAGEQLLIVSLTDGKAKQIHQKIWLSMPAVKPVPASAAKAAARPPAEWVPISAPAGAGVLFNPSLTGLREALQVFASNHNLVADGAQLKITRDSDGSTVIDQPIHSPFVGVDVPEGSSYHVDILLAPTNPTNEYFDLVYHYERPLEADFPGVAQDYVRDFVGSDAKRIDLTYTVSGPPAPAGPLAPARANPAPTDLPDPALTGTRALHAWLQRRVVADAQNKRHVEVHAYSSYELDPVKRLYNQRLSERRLAVAYAVIDEYNKLYPQTPVEISNRQPQTPLASVAHGHDLAAVNAKMYVGPRTDPGEYPHDYDPSLAARDGDYWDRAVLLRGTVGASVPGGHIVGTLKRAAAGPQPQPVPVPPRKPPPTPPDARKPGVFRRIGGRVRIERNVPVLFEIDGELDFETALETSLRKSQTQIANKLPPAGSFLGNNPNGEDGVVDFTLLVAYDTSTSYLTESLSLHSGADDQDGLVRITNTDQAADSYPWKNALGAMMVLSPILAKGLGESDLATGGGWGKLAVSWGAPALIGGLGFMRSEAITLYGGELRLRQYAPSGNDVRFSDAAILFDYGVDFQLDCFDVIKTSKPLRVRYKSVGFGLSVPYNNVDQTYEYQPIFDPSKGYEIDLSDPGLFNFGTVLGDLIRVLGARVARFNPLTLELDLGFILDLGVVKFDEFKVKWPIAYPEQQPIGGPGAPMILPAGARVDIPGTLKGGGRVHMLEDGFEGSLDLTLIPIKVRIAAGLGVRKLTAQNKTVTAVIVTLEIEFPTPIVLGATGLGIFGFNGLFAMHYKRLEGDPDPANAVGPALGWLQDAGGVPTRLSHNGKELWGPEMDRWSFGIGAILGSLDGGFLTNLRGMVLLELPGPRLLICTKMLMLSALPGPKDGFVATGVLGVLDLDFNLKQVTLGVIIDFAVKELLQIKLPIELFFSWDKPEKWHLYLGTIAQPATARILGIVNGGGYFMIAGDKIDNFPISDDEVMSLKGVAVAAGIWAGMVWGWKPVGLYLEVTARADIGVSFSPFFMIGRFNLRGELHLWVISVEAYASLTIRVDENDAFFAGEVCGKVDLVLFSAEGCIDVSFGDKDPQPDSTYPPLIQSIYLQSFAPVLTSGQGGERPIDASLGDAVLADAAPPLASLPRVPIDSVPVIQMACSPHVGAAGEAWDAGSPVAATTYTNKLKLADGLGGDPTGYAQLGGRPLRYRVKEISLLRRKAGSADPFTPATWTEVPPAVWRRDPKASNDTANSRIDLALGSRTPTTTARALERSSELKTAIELQWADICLPVAPPANVLFTACARGVGPSKAGLGWTLDGVALPDPPGTTRETPPVTKLALGEPKLTPEEQVIVDIAEEAGDRFFLPAKVVGITAKNLAELQLCKCKRGVQLPRQGPPLTKGQGAQLAKPADYYAALTALDERLWITVNTGAATQVRLFMVVDGNWQEDRFELRQLDAKGQLLKATSIKAMAPQVIAGYAQLPATWRAAPWLDETTTIYDYLATGELEFKSMSRLLITFAPAHGCVAVQLRALPGPINNKEFTLVLGAVEVRSLAEVQRFTHESAKKTEKTLTLKDFLDLGEKVPLLVPDSEYLLQVVYAVNGKTVIDVGQGVPIISVAAPAVDVTRKFFFATDAELPARLDSWVFATAPNADETFHFYAEPVVVVFNDTAALHMLDAYGAKVQYAVRGADGMPVNPPEFDGEGNPIALDPNQVSYDIDKFTKTVEAEFGSPYYDMASEFGLAAAPCAAGSGAGKQQDVVTVFAKLAPQMAYTFDLTAAPKDPNKPVKIAKFAAKVADDKPPSKAIGDLPFFRRGFKTGRYPTAAAFAVDVRAAKIRHRALDSAIVLPGNGPVSDAQMAAALTLAGEQALPAAQVNGVTVYWAAGKPHALLLDTVEPHWRTRDEPALVAVPQADGAIGDPHFRTIQAARVESLGLAQVGGVFNRFVHACGGARTLAFIDPTKVPAPGLPPVAATLQLHRPASGLYGVTPDANYELLTLPVSGRAPWDEVADDE